MNLRFTEKQTPNLSLSCEVSNVLLKKQSEFQDIAVLDTTVFGRTLVLDGFIQTTEMDEFIYHEMIVNVPLVTHPSPRNILIVGGGDGGAVREALKYPGTEKVTLVEIDREVVEASREFFPGISKGLSDPRVELCFEDGVKFLKDKKGIFDVIIIDSSEPIGPSANLFTKDFYESAYRGLTEEGILVAQTESPFYNRELIERSYFHMSGIFPLTGVYLAPVPSYPGGLWSFTLGSRKHDPCDKQVSVRAGSVNGCKYYSQDIHYGAFVLPPFISDLLHGAGKNDKK